MCVCVPVCVCVCVPVCVCVCACVCVCVCDSCFLVQTWENFSDGSLDNYEHLVDLVGAAPCSNKADQMY